MRLSDLEPIEAARQAILACGGTPCQLYLEAGACKGNLHAQTYIYIHTDLHTVSNAFNWPSWATIPAFIS